MKPVKRINSSNILSRIEEIKEEMSVNWKAFFNCPEFLEYLKTYADILLAGIFDALRLQGANIPKNVADSIEDQLDIKVVYDPNSPIQTAATGFSNKKFEITINGASELILDGADDVEGRFQICIGFLVHEIDHRIFTDFPTLTAARNKLETTGQWYPINPKSLENTVEGIRLATRLFENPEYRRTFAEFLWGISNRTEDAYIENENRAIYPGTPSYYIDVVNSVLYDRAPSMTDTYNADKEVDYLSMILGQWLIYAKFGDFKTGGLDKSEFDPEAIKTLEDGIDIIDQCIVERDPTSRAMFNNELLVMLSPWIDKKLEELDKDKPETDSGESEPKGGSKKANEQLREMLRRLIEQIGGGDDDDGKSENSTKSMTNPDSGFGRNIDQNALKKGSGGPGMRGKHENRDTTAAVRALDDILTKNAAKQAVKEAEVQRSKDMNEEAQEELGKDAPDIIRASEVSESNIRAYDEFYKTIVATSKRIQRLLKKRFKEESEEDITSKLYSGNRFNTKRYIRDNLRAFERRTYNEQTINLEVTVLIDESGSMCGENEKAAVRTAILLEDFCRGIKIPLTVHGYTTGRTGCDLFSYVEPNKFDNNDRYRLTGIAARAGTPTVQAMKYELFRAKKSDPKRSKIMFVFTDGGAGDDDCDGSRTKALIEEYKRMKGQVIACGLGFCKGEVCSEFGQANYIPVDNLDEMPEHLVSILSKKVQDTRI